MTAKSFGLGLLIVVFLGMFIFSGGCALLPAIECILKTCGDFSGAFIFIGTFFTYLSVVILLKLLKYTALSARVLKYIFGVCSVLMTLVIMVIICYYIVGKNNFNFTDLVVALIYIGCLTLFTSITINNWKKL